jgi:hypothetical protein
MRPPYSFRGGAAEGGFVTPRDPRSVGSETPNESGPCAVPYGHVSGQRTATAAGDALHPPEAFRGFSAKRGSRGRLARSMHTCGRMPSVGSTAGRRLTLRNHTELPCRTLSGAPEVYTVRQSRMIFCWASNPKNPNPDCKIVRSPFLVACAPPRGCDPQGDPLPIAASILIWACLGTRNR